MLVSSAKQSKGNLTGYLTNTLQAPVQMHSWPQTRSLPIFLAKRYEFFEAEIFGVRCLFAVDSALRATPGEIAKHIHQIRRAFYPADRKALVIYVTDKVSARQREGMIANHIAFVVPNRQLYMPQLALELREQFSQHIVREEKQLSPVTQAVLFHILLRCDDRATTPSRISKALYYTAMSIGRAFEELAQFNLARIEAVGRNKSIALAGDRRDLLVSARMYLRTPVKKKHYVLGIDNAMFRQYSGETALAKLTELTAPRTPVLAIHYKDWEVSSRLARSIGNIEEIQFADEAAATIELWHYKPDVLMQGDIVDPLSLYAAYWDHADERVAQAAEDLLELVPW